MATRGQEKLGLAFKKSSSKISVAKLSFPGIIDLDICFVKMPGFNYTWTSDTKILKMISDCLNNRSVEL